MLHPISFLTKKHLKIEVPLQICQSRNGYYIGAQTTEEQCENPHFEMEYGPVGSPLSRDSVEYFPTKEEAEEALKNGTWTQRQHP